MEDVEQEEPEGAGAENLRTGFLIWTGSRWPLPKLMISHDRTCNIIDMMQHDIFQGIHGWIMGIWIHGIHGFPRFQNDRVWRAGSCATVAEGEKHAANGFR